MRTITSRGLLVLALLASIACGRQAEGEPCSHNNGNDDCASGLLCTAASKLGGNSDICCPPEGSSLPACIPGALGTPGATSAQATSAQATAGGTGGAGGSESTAAGTGGA